MQARSVLLDVLIAGAGIIGCTTALAKRVGAPALDVAVQRHPGQAGAGGECRRPASGVALGDNGQLSIGLVP